MARFTDHNVLFLQQLAALRHPAELKPLPSPWCLHQLVSRNGRSGVGFVFI